ncbi:hypothetical protein EYV94_21590 [Puteibacter caeruleilacunae]|nr:hypothetical protein EYV94_21590 [Puteibacter caeruleilacunae]
MRHFFIVVSVLSLFIVKSYAQTGVNNPIVQIAEFKAENYGSMFNKSGDNKHIIKIKTQFPFNDGSQMPALFIEGYDYGGGNMVGLTLGWYIYGGQIINADASSYGSVTPKITLGVEDNLIVIQLEKNEYQNWYYSRFIIRGFNSKNNNPSWLENWTFSNTPLNSIVQTEVPCNNTFDKGEFKGNVTIGTKGNNNQLKVYGTISTAEIKVSANGGADFVFEDDYDLKSLDEVEEFVKEHKHLPGISSAKEMEEKGVGLAEMNKLLLQKVEELTLYMIEYKKTNDAQEEKLKVLMEQNKKLQSQIDKLNQ